MTLFKKIQDLRQKRSEAVTAAREILDTAEAEKRSLTDDEKGRWEELHGTIESLSDDIKRLERQHTATMLAAASEHQAEQKKPDESSRTVMPLGIIGSTCSW